MDFPNPLIFLFLPPPTWDSTSTGDRPAGLRAKGLRKSSMLCRKARELKLPTGGRTRPTAGLVLDWFWGLVLVLETAFGRVSFDSCFFLKDLILDLIYRFSCVLHHFCFSMGAQVCF